MGDHGIEVESGGSGRHRAEFRDEFRTREVELPDLVELLALLAALRSCLGDGAGERGGAGERAGAGERDGAGERAGRKREGRHSAAGASAGSRPWAVSTGRHAAERQALRQPVVRSAQPVVRSAQPVVRSAQPVVRSGRHRVPGAESDPATAGGSSVGGGLTSGGLTSGGVMNRWSSVAAILARAAAHETPISALARETPVVAPVRAVRAPEVPRRVEDSVAERWASEQWMPAQRQSAPDTPAIRATRRRCEPDAPAVRPVGWHPVPRPRPAADTRPANPPAPEVSERLAG